MNKKLLIVAAHPDDEILGCGATVAQLVRDGFSAYALILGEGITSRDPKRNAEKRRNELKELKIHMGNAHKRIGIRKSYVHDLPDNRFDTVAFLDIVKLIEDVKDEVKPALIFTHYENDLNIDHRITYKAVLTAARPLASEVVKEIYCFEVLSSTEWSFQYPFAPDTFFDVKKTINNKLMALKEYKTELRQYPHPRSLEGVELSAKYWGQRVGLHYAEAFKTVRRIR